MQNTEISLGGNNTIFFLDTLYLIIFTFRRPHRKSLQAPLGTPASRTCQWLSRSCRWRPPRPSCHPGRRAAAAPPPPSSQTGPPQPGAAPPSSSSSSCWSCGPGGACRGDQDLTPGNRAAADSGLRRRLAPAAVALDSWCRRGRRRGKEKAAVFWSPATKPFIAGRGSRSVSA